jgi:hypothetical protein
LIATPEHDCWAADRIGRPDSPVSELFTHVEFTDEGPIPSGGDVKKVPFAHPDQHISLTNEQLTFPAGVAVGPDAAVYAVNGSTYVEVGGGEIVRLTNH